MIVLWWFSSSKNVTIVIQVDRFRDSSGTTLVSPVNLAWLSSPSYISWYWTLTVDSVAVYRLYQLLLLLCFLAAYAHLIVQTS